jgi:2-haloacid dehalogenase
MKIWRIRQFEYQWLRALSGRHADFMQATEESLLFAVKQLGLSLSEKNKQRFMSAYMNLSVWPDAKS